MSTDGFVVAAGQLRAHAAHVEAVMDRFGNVKGASSQIANNDAAYGLLCGWIAGILEGRHTRQNELFDYVQENLRLAAQGLRQTADAYQSTDSTAATRIGQSFTAPPPIPGDSGGRTPGGQRYE